MTRLSQDKARFLPLMAEALKDIYAKMDEIIEKFGSVEQNLQQFITSMGQKNMLIIQNLKKLQNIVTDLRETDKLKTTIKTINETVTDIRDGIWFLEFQNVLSRFKDKIDEF